MRGKSLLDRARPAVDAVTVRSDPSTRSAVTERSKDARAVHVGISREGVCE